MAKAKILDPLNLPKDIMDRSKWVWEYKRSQKWAQVPEKWKTSDMLQMVFEGRLECRTTRIEGEA